MTDFTAWRTTLEDMDLQLHHFLYRENLYMAECANFVLVWL